MLVVEPALVWSVAIGGLMLSVLLLHYGASTRVHSIDRRSLTPRVVHRLKTAVPIIGDALEIASNSDRRHHWFWEHCRRLNYEPWQIRIPGILPMVVVSTPEAAEDVLAKQSRTFERGPTVGDMMRDVLGNGLANADGDHWYRQRKIAAKFFTTKTLRLCMMQSMKKNVAKLCEAIDGNCDGSALVDLSLFFHQFTLETFLEVGVGVGCPIIGESDPHPIGKAIDATSPVISRRAFLPAFVWKLERWLNAGKEKVLAQAIKVIVDDTKSMISQSLSKGDQGLDADGEGIRSAIDLYVQYSQEANVTANAQDLVDFVVTFVIAARDTSSLTMLWLFYSILTKPEVEAKIRAEMQAKLPALGVEGDAYILDVHVKQLAYLEATIKETLRLYPAAPLLVREASQDTVIDNDVIIRKSQTVVIPVYAMSRNPQVWGPDAEEFKPERWIDPTTGALIQMPSNKFLTFGTGPRSCIGMKLAMLNLRVGTANLLHRYNLTLDLGNDGSYANAVTLNMKHHLLVSATRR